MAFLQSASSGSTLVGGGNRTPGIFPPRRCPVQSCKRCARAGHCRIHRLTSAAFGALGHRDVVCCSHLEDDMRYSLKQIHCRPWTLSYLSIKLIESHYENDYGGALRRLNAITKQLESLDFAGTPGHVLNALKREELVALNSTLLHELYFASLGGDGQPTEGMTEILARDFGSLDRWRTEFSAMGYALGGGSGWVLLTYIPRDGRLINQYAA